MIISPDTKRSHTKIREKIFLSSANLLYAVEKESISQRRVNRRLLLSSVDGRHKAGEFMSLQQKKRRKGSFLEVVTLVVYDKIMTNQ